VRGDNTITTAEEQRHPIPKAPSKLEQWLPIAVWLPKCRWNKFLLPDLIAGISFVPESLGYASVAGVPVERGLYAAPIALIAYTIFGGSRLLVFAAAGSVAALSASLIGAVVLISLIVALLVPDIDLVKSIPSGLPKITFPTDLDITT